jgi:hypothetical protein
MNMNRDSAADTGPDPERARDASAALSEAAEDAQMLKDLAQIGMRLARLIEANAEARMTENPACDLGRADQMFAKISRSVRQTLALKTKLAEMREKPKAPIEKDVQEQEAEAARRRSRKAMVERAVTETIEAESGPSDRENLLSDLHERLLDPDIEADLTSRSIGELVAGICDDLGLKPDREVWKRKGWYLTESWHTRLPKPEPGEQAPEEHWALGAVRDLEEMDAMTNCMGPRRRYAVTGEGRIVEIGRDEILGPPEPTTGSGHDPPEDEGD